MAPRRHMAGLVELANQDALMDRLGKSSYRELVEDFHRRLQGWVRSRDEWLRLEDDRFYVVLQGLATRAGLELATAKLQRLLQDPHINFGKPIALEFTAGFTAVEEASFDKDTAIREANLALREARRNGRPFELYSPESGLIASQEKELAKRLAEAIRQDELALFYQPKVHAGYHSLMGAEALVRWIRDGRVVGPDEFIGAAERHDVIAPLTWWVIKAAVARLARWPASLTLSVNVAPPLLMDDRILNVVKDALEIHAVAPSRLILEVTERVMVEEQQTMLQQLGRLQDLGVKISLDDFGTGFSSLAYFRDLPVDEIKIDKGFVMNMMQCDKDHAIVKAVIDLAHNFSLPVVAEGVETLEVARRLSELGCDLLQGYVFDRPLDQDRFETSYGLKQPGSTQRGTAPVRTH